MIWKLKKILIECQRKEKIARSKTKNEKRREINERYQSIRKFAEES